MKTSRLILLGAVLGEIVFLSSAQAQIYSPRRLTRPIAPQMQRAPAQTPARQPPPSTPAPTAPTAPTAPAVSAPALRPVVRPPIDPAVAKAAREEADRKAFEFQKKRAEEGSESAQYELGMRYLKGEGVEKDEALARKWLTQSSKNGYTPATRRLEELDKAALAPADPKASKPEVKPTQDIR